MGFPVTKSIMIDIAALTDGTARSDKGRFCDDAVFHIDLKRQNHLRSWGYDSSSKNLVVTTLFYYGHFYYAS